MNNSTDKLKRLASGTGSLILAIDIDGCWTLDSRLFSYMAQTFITVGWQVIIVTGANQPADKLERLGITRLGIPVIVSGSDFKEHAARKAGYNVNVWLDDMPGMIQNCRIITDNLDSGNSTTDNSELLPASAGFVSVESQKPKICGVCGETCQPDDLKCDECGYDLLPEVKIQNGGG